MPTIPSTKNLNAHGADILNAIRNTTSPYYQTQVIAADKNNLGTLRQIGTTLINNDNLMNEFLTSLINRIGLVWVTSKLYTNPWAFMKKGLLELGETVEEIFVNLAQPRLYDVEEAETDVFKREIPDVDAVFHSLNYKIFYKQTIQNDSLRQAFLTWDGIVDLIARITNAMYSAVAYDEFLVMKYMVSMAITNGNMWTETIPAQTDANMKSIVAAMKSVSNLATFMRNQYNTAGVTTSTDKADQYMIINSKFDAEMAVEVLATSFNMDKAALMGRVVLVDDFSTFDTARINTLIGGIPNFTQLTTAQLQALANVPAVLVDKDWFMIFDQMLKFTEIYNNQGLYWNYTLHTWKIFSYSPFTNAIAFTTTTQSVTAVTVTPSTATVNAGSELTLTASVTGTGFITQAVTWSTNNSKVTINTMGKLTIPKGTTGSITVTATSKADPTKSGTATITIGG